jgi:hypothetical protein
MSNSRIKIRNKAFSVGPVKATFVYQIFSYINFALLMPDLGNASLDASSTMQII